MIRQRQQALAALATFALTLIGLQATVGRWLGQPRAAVFEAKWRGFERCADDCDIVFMGTSHVERHVDPRLADETLDRYGIAAKSYNLGLPKMSMREAAELIERLEHRHPRRLKLVVIEPTLYLYDAENWASDRATAVHDWSNTALAVRLTWHSEARRQTSVWGKVGCIWPHALSYLHRSLNLRRGSDIFLGSAERSRACQSATVSSCDPRGFVPLSAIEPPAGGELPDWQRRFVNFLKIEPDWNGPGLSAAEIEYFDRLIKRVEQIGAEPVFLLGPKVKRDSHTAAVLATHAKRFGAVPLLDYLRGHDDTDVYQLCYWHDFDHLNSKGAALFSRRLAEDLCRLLSETRSAQTSQRRTNQHR